jgi:uncharacterized protein (TIGR03435 family)
MKVLNKLLFFVALPICAGFDVPMVTLSRPQAESAPLKFEAVSIKPVKLVRGMIRGGGCRGWDTPSFYAAGPYTMGLGRCRILATDLKNLIADAFGEGQNHFSITGAQGWMTDDPFTIEAKSEDDIKATREQLLQMMQNFIVQQFHLKFHRETKEVPGYDLVVAKDGPKWTTLKDTEPRRPGFGGRGELSGQTDPAHLAGALSSHLGVPVSDKTGLADRFEINLKWFPSPTDRDASPDTDPAGPSIFTVLQKELGLRLIPQKIRVQIFVIDSAERPAFNQ